MAGNLTGSLVVKSVSAVVILWVMLLSVMLAVPATVSADATHPKWVSGYVIDIMGNPQAGWEVSVTIDGNTKTETSASDGFYQVQFAMTEWTVGSTIYVEATHESKQAENDTLADDSFVQVVNVQYPYEIPQFGGTLGLLIAGAFVAVVSIVLLTDKKRK
jgi:hypothetical protein